MRMATKQLILMITSDLNSELNHAANTHILNSVKPMSKLFQMKDIFSHILFMKSKPMLLEICSSCRY